MLKYMVAAIPDQRGIVEARYKLAGDGEPVIPWFPAPPRNIFLSLVSWNFADYARVAESTFNLDKFVDDLAAQYPGLPRCLHERYVLETATVAGQLPTGTLVRTIVELNTTHIQVHNTATIFTLWTQQPIKG